MLTENVSFHLLFIKISVLIDPGSVSVIVKALDSSSPSSAATIDATPDAVLNPLVYGTPAPVAGRYSFV